MFTSTLVLAVASYLATNTREPALWHTDYSAAQQLAAQGHKPLAVFLGSGKAGWQQISREGELHKEIKQLLGKNYICVYVDTSLQDGRALASEFAVRKGPGLVVSDPTGRYQAFRHEGDLSGEQLKRYLNRYADPSRPVRTTETERMEYVSQYVPESYPTPVSAYYPPIRYAPVYSTPVYSAPVGRSC